MFRLPITGQSVTFEWQRFKQKVSGCFRHQRYADAYCRISSYLQTMANKGVNPLVAIQIALAGEVPDVDSDRGVSSYLSSRLFNVKNHRFIRFIFLLELSIVLPEFAGEKQCPVNYIHCSRNSKFLNRWCCQKTILKVRASFTNHLLTIDLHFGIILFL